MTPPLLMPTLTPTLPSGFVLLLKFDAGVSAAHRSAFDAAARRWSKVITGSLSRFGRPYDLLIYVKTQNIDGEYQILGKAGPTYVRRDSFLPVEGNMTFDKADLDRLAQTGVLNSVIFHEMGHVLGIGTLWNRPPNKFLNGAGGRFPETMALKQYNFLLQARKNPSPKAIGVPVEGSSAPVGTRDGHWRESTFGDEIMTGYLSGSFQPLSAVTIASLADLGYEVNLSARDSFSLDRLNFVRSSIPSESIDFYCVYGKRKCEMLRPSIQLV